MSSAIRRRVAPSFFALVVAITLIGIGFAGFAEDHHGRRGGRLAAGGAGEAQGRQQAVRRTEAVGQGSGQRRAATADGQQPYAIILACADSRVAPELVFDETIGDLFVIRVAGNVVDPDVLGSIEYAVEHLHARLIVVLGHEKCGAVTAAISNERRTATSMS